MNGGRLETSGLRDVLTEEETIRDNLRRLRRGEVVTCSSLGMRRSEAALDANI